MFSWRRTHPVALNGIAKAPNQKVARQPKCFSFLLFFWRASSKLHDSFAMVFAQNSIFHWVVHQPIAFFQVWSHTRRFEPLTEELWLPLRRHFSSRVRMRTNHSRCFVSDKMAVQNTPEWVCPQPSQQFLAVILRYMNLGLFVLRVVCLQKCVRYCLLSVCYSVVLNCC